MNFIPDQPGSAPNYWCTWNAQHPMWYLATDEELASFDYLQACAGGNAARHNMRQEFLFGTPGVAANFWSTIRGDLYLCLDDGWDVPDSIHPATEIWKFGSLVLNEERFPDFTGTPAQRLRTLNDHLKSLGWRGLALWVSAQCEGDGRDGQEVPSAACQAYWRERAQWCADAGIEYWKVDWGHRASSSAFRRCLTEIARQEAPQLLVEHACCMPPLNNLNGNRRFADWSEVFPPSLDVLAFSDVFRTYDDMPPLNTATTLDRITAWGGGVAMEPGARGLFNCEDNAYLAAALGGTIGIMRVPVKNPWTRWQWPQIDEALRAIRWQRIAPPVGVADVPLQADTRILTDNAFVRKDYWYVEAAGQDIHQYAPAIVSRGLPLPRVDADGEPPYVVAYRHPSGPTAIATLPRCLDGALQTPPADVEIDIDGETSLLAVFGRYRRLRVRVPQHRQVVKVWGQDLLADQAHDITHRVMIDQHVMMLDGTLIAEIGLAAKHDDDPSDPGLLLKLEYA